MTQSSIQIVNNSLERFAQVYDRPNVADKLATLLDTFGMAELTDYVFDVNNYQAITATNGIINGRDICKNGKVPVTTLGVGDNSLFLATQHPRMEFDTDAMDQQVKIENYDSTAASVWWDYAKYRRGSTVTVKRGSPLLVISNYAEIKKLGRTCPSVIAHEMIHIAQTLSYTPKVYDADVDHEETFAASHLKDELQAYAAQAALFDTIIYDHEPVLSIDAAMIVNQLRIRAQGDEFTVSKPLTELLLRDKIASRILPEFYKPAAA